MSAGPDSLTVVRSLLGRVHPSWFGLGDPGLREAALGSALGRRMLAGHLDSLGFGPALRPSERAGWVQRVDALEQLQAPGPTLLLDLGAAALAPWWRAVVSREGVASLREVLGEAGYRRLLDHSHRSEGLPDPPYALDQDRRLSQAGAVRARLIQQGAAEWRQFQLDSAGSASDGWRLLLPRTLAEPGVRALLPVPLRHSLLEQAHGQRDPS